MKQRRAQTCGSKQRKTYEIRARSYSRYERLGAVIDDRKLIDFTALEENVFAYAETQHIALLRRRSAPLTETQRDGVLEILIDVSAR